MSHPGSGTNRSWPVRGRRLADVTPQFLPRTASMPRPRRLGPTGALLRGREGPRRVNGLSRKIASPRSRWRPFMRRTTFFWWRSSMGILGMTQLRFRRSRGIAERDGPVLEVGLRRTGRQRHYATDGQLSRNFAADRLCVAQLLRNFRRKKGLHILQPPPPPATATFPIVRILPTRLPQPPSIARLPRTPRHDGAQHSGA